MLAVLQSQRDCVFLAQDCEERAALVPKLYGFQLLLQLRDFLFELFLPFRRQFTQHTGFALAQLAKLVIGTFPADDSAIRAQR